VLVVSLRTPFTGGADGAVGSVRRPIAVRGGKKKNLRYCRLGAPRV